MDVSTPRQKLVEKDRMRRMDLKTSRTATRMTPSVVRRMSIQVNLLNGSIIKYDKNIDEPLLHHMDGLFAHYHYQWWYRRQMFYHFK